MHSKKGCPQQSHALKMPAGGGGGRSPAGFGAMTAAPAQAPAEAPPDTMAMSSEEASAIAVASGSEKIAELKALSAQPHTQTSLFKQGQRQLCAAIEAGNGDAVRMLILEGASPSIPGFVPLDASIYRQLDASIYRHHSLASANVWALAQRGVCVRWTDGGRQQTVSRAVQPIAGSTCARWLFAAVGGGRSSCDDLPPC